MKSTIFTGVAALLLSAGMAAPALAAEGTGVLPARKLVPWKMEQIERISGVDGKGEAVQKLEQILDGKPTTFPNFGKMLNAELNIQFKQPQQIEYLAVRQGGWNNWAVPKCIEVTINGGEPVTFELEDAARDRNRGVDGPLQFLPIRASVKDLKIKVKEVHPREGRAPWGAIFCDIGTGQTGPLEVKFKPQVLPGNATGVELLLRSEKAHEVPVKVIVGLGMEYDAPALTLKEGENRCRIMVDEVKKSREYGIDFTAANIAKIIVGEKDGPELLEMKPIGAEFGDDYWFEMEPIPAEYVVRDGRKYRRGLSLLSTGRFGNSTYNGLISDTVGDFWFQTYTAGPKAPLRRQKFDLSVKDFKINRQEADAGQPWSVAFNNAVISEKIDNSWTSMIREIPLNDHEQFRFIVSSLVPGFLLESDREFALSSRGGGDIPYRSGAPNENESRFFADNLREGEIPRLGPGMVVTPDEVISGSGQIDWSRTEYAVAIWGGIDSPGYWGDEAAAVLITADAGVMRWDAAEMVFSADTGTVGFSSAFQGLLKPGWDAEAIRARAEILTGLLHNYALKCEELFAVEEDGIDIINEFEYYSWGRPERRAGNYAPIPPILSWGAISRNWELPQESDLVLPTPIGPYRWLPGKNSVRYKLPRFAPRHAAFPRNAESEEYYAKLSEELLKLPLPEDRFMVHGSSWLTSFRTPLFVGSSILGAPGLSDEARDRLYATTRRAVENAFHAAAWFPRRELFSKRPYLASLWVDLTVKPAMFGDINSGIGTANYILYAYAKYTGDWALAEKLWPRAMDTLRFGFVVNDWAIPMLSAREGVLFGGIDMDTVSQLGLMAAEKTAEQLGKTEDYQLLAYLNAKNAATTALRLNFMRYLDPENKVKNLWFNGFSESGPNPEFAKSTDGVGLDHAAMCFSWDGQHPESFWFMMDALGEENIAAYQREIMDGFFRADAKVNWICMPFNFSRTASHLTARALLKEMPEEEFERDVRAYMAHNAQSQNRENAGFWSLYFGRRDGIYLTDWQPARLGGLYFDREQRELRAALSCATPFVLKLASPLPVKAVQVDGRETEVAVRPGKRSGDFVLELPAVEKEVVIVFDQES